MSHWWKLCGVVLSLVSWTAEAVEPGTLSLDEATRARCLKVLRGGLKSDEFWPSMHAAEGLSVSGFGAEVRESVALKVPTETDDQRRCGLARELVRAGDAARVQTLFDILGSEKPHGHTHAAESLFKIRQVGDGSLLKRAMARDEQPKLAIMAAAALARSGNAEAFVMLRKYVRHQDGEVAKLAAWVLARVGNSSDLPALRDGARRFKEPLTKAYFEHALAVLGDQDGQAALVRNLGHADPAVRTYACEFAPDARAISAKPALLKLLDDDVLDIRIRAAQALLQLSQSRND